MTGEHGLYVVVGPREYMGVAPGGRFMAKLDRGAERRAIVRGDIRLLERITPSIEPDRATFPKGWPDK